jgi:hypothetical protein
MDFLKAFFEEKDTEKSYEAFQKWAAEKGFEVADVKSGGYKRKEDLDRKLAAQAEKLKAEWEAKIAELQKAGGKKPDGEPPGASGGAIAAELAECKRQLEALQKEHEAAKKKSAYNEARALYVEAGGNPKNAERDVSWLFGKAADESPFADLLASYKKENPEVFGADSPKRESLSTIPNVKGGEERKKAEEEAEAQARKIMGLEKKKE